MKRLELSQLELVEGGKVNGWNCASAVLGSIGVTLGAGAIVAGSGGAGLGLAVFLVGKAAATLSIIGNCSPS